jgi:AAA domain/TrwC relaxase
VAVVATLSKGYDLDYIWKQVDRGPAKDAAGYYIQASESGGEPPGRWWGRGAAALGLEPGQVVEREAYDLLFGARRAPDGTQLGRAPGGGRKATDIYARLLAAEPHATADRRHELSAEAARQARRGPLFLDLTISLSKSISIFHASLGENVRLARQARDAAGEGYWSGLVAEVDEMIWQAVRAGFDYFQREAGYTRTGSHNTRVHGRESGQWHEADLAVAHWLQHTSRDGDMQLHVHSQIAHVARTGIDGKWRAPGGPGSPGPWPSQVEVRRAAQKAVALAQQDKSTFTPADVIKYLGRVLPRTGMDPAAAAALLEQVADRALASEFEPVACLEAPEPAEAPRSLLRADGRSVYQRHGRVRFATHAQLTMEQRMLALARASGAPCLDRAQAARALGADLAQLEAALAGRAPEARGARTRTGLRVDQAAAALSVLSDGRRVSVINAPAGSGKTWVLAAAGQAWAAAGLGRVIGITPSQSARNTLAEGVPVSYNSAQFLGHLPGQRGARGPVRLGPGDLILMDEASMVSNPDLADVIGQAADSGAKVILAGDTQQLQAVESGGGMSLLADALGFVQLAEPVRFRSAWEQAASLRLRAGDITVLAEYDQHARIRGGDPEQMMDAAASAYLALTMDGRTCC